MALEQNAELAHFAVANFHHDQIVCQLIHPRFAFSLFVGSSIQTAIEGKGYKTIADFASQICICIFPQASLYCRT
jgi:hypothetical protein